MVGRLVGQSRALCLFRDLHQQLRLSLGMVFKTLSKQNQIIFSFILRSHPQRVCMFYIVLVGPTALVVSDSVIYWLLNNQPEQQHVLAAGSGLFNIVALLFLQSATAAV